jgi:hypothetical protein
MVCRGCASIFEIDRKRKSIGKGGKRVIVFEGVFSIQKSKINKEGEIP